MSFIQRGRPDPDDKEAILDALISSAEQAFGRDFTPDEVSVIRAFYDPVAEYLATQQEDIATVLDSSQIDHAEGQALDLRASLIGVERKMANAASTRLQFRHDTPVGTDYTIPKGSGARTDNTDAVKFETDSQTALRFLDGFEDGDILEYDGDSADFSVQSTTVYEGDNALEAAAANSLIVDAGNEIEQGARFHVREYLNTGTAPGFLFGVQDTSNFYRVVVDESAGEARIEVVDGGSTTQIESSSASIPTGEWLHVQIDWNHDGDFDVTVEDSTEASVVTVAGSESSATYTTGGIGFSSEDTAGTKYFDNATTSRVSVDATAVDTGAETNVGANTLIILSDAISGVDSVTNPIASSGGRDTEEDDDFRVRVKNELSNAMRATLPALINRLDSLNQTRSVTVIDNDTGSTDGDGRPAHSFEAVVDVDSSAYDDVARQILDTKAVGDTSVGGHAGTSVTRTLELVNGQTKDITFSTPTQVKIYVDCSLTKTDEYAGDEDVQDNIVQYIGGVLNSGDNVDGELGSGDDVVYNQVLEAVMSVEGVHDVSTLEVDTSSPPAGTSNVSITSTETANADATDGSIGITSSDA